MSVKYRFFLMFLCISFLISGCTHTSSSNNQLKSVVGASRSLCDMWLLAGGQLTGITQDANDLDDVDNADVIGSNSRLNIEAIVALDPDLVLLSSSIPAHKSTGKTLESMGVTCQYIKVDSFDDYAHTMKTLTTMTGRDDLYQKNVADVRERIDTLLAQHHRVNGTYLTLRMSSTKIIPMEDDFFVCRMLNDLSLTNLAGNKKQRAHLSLEALLEWNPDYMFIVTQGDESKALELYKNAYQSQKAWQSLKAVQQQHVYQLPKTLFEYKPNEKWDEAYDYLNKILES